MYALLATHKIFLLKNLVFGPSLFVGVNDKNKTQKTTIKRGPNNNSQNPCLKKFVTDT